LRPSAPAVLRLIVSSILVGLYNWYARYTQGAAAVVPKGLILSLIVVCILGFTGWKDGTWSIAVGSELLMRMMLARRANRRGALRKT
jgi:uncharacterized membrane protein